MPRRKGKKVFLGRKDLFASCWADKITTAARMQGVPFHTRCCYWEGWLLQYEGGMRLSFRKEIA